MACPCSKPICRTHPSSLPCRRAYSATSRCPCPASARRPTPDKGGKGRARNQIEEGQASQTVARQGDRQRHATQPTTGRGRRLCPRGHPQGRWQGPSPKAGLGSKLFRQDRWQGQACPQAASAKAARRQGPRQCLACSQATTGKPRGKGRLPHQGRAPATNAKAGSAVDSRLARDSRPCSRGIAGPSSACLTARAGSPGRPDMQSPPCRLPDAQEERPAGG